MPNSSFFSGLDQVSEQPNKSHRNNHAFPSSLQDSPYLSSPIRPIPSFSRNRSSNMSVSSKRSRKVATVCGRLNSPAQSTVGSLRLTSPYSESIFSLHSLCTTSTKNVESERQSLSRTVLLPHEIDVLAKQLKVEQGDIQREREGKDADDDDSQYDLSDFDDDSTIASDIAKSINDEIVFQKIQVEGDDELLYDVKDIVPKEVSIMGEDAMKNTCDSAESNSQSIKLPSVNVEETFQRNGKQIFNSPEKRSKFKQQQHKSPPSSIIKSPYAVSQAKPKRSTRKKKKGHNNHNNKGL
jgi:hypothetical protein